MAVDHLPQLWRVFWPMARAMIPLYGRREENGWNGVGSPHSFPNSLLFGNGTPTTSSLIRVIAEGLFTRITLTGPRALWEINPTACKELLQQWSIIHHRRRNLWRALRAKDLIVAGTK